MARRRRKRCSSRPSREEDVRQNVHDRRARFAGALGRRALLRKQTRRQGCLFFPLTGARRGHAAGARELRRALRTDARDPGGRHHFRRPSLDVRTSHARALVERAAKSHQLVRLQTAAPLGPPRARGDAVPGAAHVRGGAHVTHGVHGDDARGARAVVVREVSRAGAGRETKKLFGRRREKRRRRVVEKKQKKTRRRRRRARAAARARRG
mmetsp:Transcript_1647/g.6570  ORF Transcript_1647/g.6570 Transcript_1647/m.6570 type:complete len:210 (+) Transcript_1647:783-1412(+)